MKKDGLLSGKNFFANDAPNHLQRIWEHIRFSVFMILSLDVYILVSQPVLSSKESLLFFLVGFVLLPLIVSVIPKLKRGSIFIISISSNQENLTISYFEGEVKKSLTLEINSAEINMSLIFSASNRYALDFLSDGIKVLRQHSSQKWSHQQMINVVETFCDTDNPTRKDLSNIRWYSGIPEKPKLNNSSKVPIQ